MSSRHESFRSPRAEIESAAEDDLASLVVVLHGPPAFYARSTAIRPEMVSAMPELARTLGDASPSRAPFRREAPAGRVARDLRAYVRALSRYRRSEARFAEAASYPGRGTESGYTRRADRLGAAFERQIDALSSADGLALTALHDLGVVPGLGGVRLDGLLLALHRSLDDGPAQVVVVHLSEIVDIDPLKECP